MPTTYFQSVPTTNTIDLSIHFYLNNKKQATLAVNESATFTFGADTIGVGSDPNNASLYQMTGSNVTITPGNIAYVSRGETGQMLLQYAIPNGTQNTVIFQSS